jgi:hypothetical protein
VPTRSWPPTRARRFATAHNLGEAIGDAFAEAGREIVSHPVAESFSLDRVGHSRRPWSIHDGMSRR